MKKYFDYIVPLFILFIISLSSCSSNSTSNNHTETEAIEHENTTEIVYHDPVCGMQVSEDNVAATIEHEGKTIGFCSEMCKERFEKSPESFLAK